MEEDKEGADGEEGRERGEGGDGGERWSAPWVTPYHRATFIRERATLDMCIDDITVLFRGARGEVGSAASVR